MNWNDPVIRAALKLAQEAETVTDVWAGDRYAQALRVALDDFLATVGDVPDDAWAP